MISTYKKETKRRKARKQAEKKQGKALPAVLIIAIAVFILLKTNSTSSNSIFSPPDRKAAASCDNIQTNFEVDLNELAALITDDMYTFTACQSDIDELYKTAEEYPEYRDNIHFFIEHIGAYSQAGITTILMAPEKTDFILLEPFSKDDGSAYEAEISVQKGEIPFLIQYDSRWAFHIYGSSSMGNTGCGPTCLSMAAIGLTGNTGYTPPYVSDYAMNSGYYVYGAGTAWSLFTDGAADFGLRGEVIPADEETMRDRLKKGEVIIASMQEGDFTRGGHFIVIHGCGTDGFMVHDPSSIMRSGIVWSFDRLYPQIAQLWSLSRA
ncbi:MAG: hypothetical protein GXY26_01155 [Clostridiales bacterium]|nr:hypothetical protein [Clostridiales bacterium]